MSTTIGASQDIDTITIDSLDSVTLPSIDLSNLTSGSFNWNTTPPTVWSTANNSLGNITINSTGYGSNPIYTTIGANGTSSGLYVSTDATFEGDIKWKGKSLGDMLEKINQRLAILTPDLEKLEHFSALKKAYDHYKMLEALCEVPKEEDDQ